MENYKTLEQLIKSRKSTRQFSGELPSANDINKLLEAAVYAPFGGATGIPLNQLRKLFVFKQHSDSMTEARRLILTNVKKGARTFSIILSILPFLKKKMKPFANRLKMISENGIPSLEEAPYFIVIAEKKGFPPVAKQSIAHALENVWLTATSMGLGFQLISATGQMGKSRQFMKLLNLKKGEYEIEGCAIGYPKKIPNEIGAWL